MMQNTRAVSVKTLAQMDEAKLLESGQSSRHLK